MTCTCYGAAFYAYGILLDPIHTEFGWSLTFLGSVFAVAQLISAFGASVGADYLTVGEDNWFQNSGCRVRVVVHCKLVPERSAVRSTDVNWIGVYGRKRFLPCVNRYSGPPGLLTLVARLLYSPPSAHFAALYICRLGPFSSTPGGGEQRYRSSQ